MACLWKTLMSFAHPILVSNFPISSLTGSFVAMEMKCIWEEIVLFQSRFQRACLTRQNGRFLQHRFRNIWWMILVKIVVVCYLGIAPQMAQFRHAWTEVLRRVVAGQPQFTFAAINDINERCGLLECGMNERMLDKFMEPSESAALIAVR